MKKTKNNKITIISSPKNKNKKNNKTERKTKYKFKNFFKSEKQLDFITHRSDPELILKSYDRIINIYAKNHVRERVELEDLISEAKKGICEAIAEFNKPRAKKKNYTFSQACLYKIREAVYQYCLRNINQIKTPYYIQRGCMHVGQILKLLQNQSVAEQILRRRGPVEEHEIIDFLYDQKERLPLKPKKFIKAQINKKVSKKEFDQIYSGILNHQLGSKHSYVKNNLTDVGKVLHIKEKIWYSATSNTMNYKRVMDLILEARKSQVSLDPSLLGESIIRTEATVISEELFNYGKKVCGDKNFSILIDSKCFDLTYEEISKRHDVKKNAITDIIKNCINILKKDSIFLEWFKEL